MLIHPARERIVHQSSVNWVSAAKDEWLTTLNLAATDPDPTRIGLGYLEQARSIYRRIGDRRGEANAYWGIGSYRYFRGLMDDGVGDFRNALTIFKDVGDRTMEAWSLHMLGTGLLRAGEIEAARGHIVHAMRHFNAAGDAAGITMCLGDLSVVAMADGDYPRAARLHGATGNLAAVTGAELAGLSEAKFASGVVPTVRSRMSETDLARYGAEGAAMTLDEAVAYALEGAGPTDPDEA